MSRIYGLSKSRAMQLASKIKKQNTNFQEAIVYQPTIFHEWQITPAGGDVTLSRLNQQGFNTIRIPLFSPKTTVKNLVNIFIKWLLNYTMIQKLIQQYFIQL